jgi:hypothetical protein
MTEQTVILSVHPLRFRARRRERALQQLLDTGHTPQIIDGETLSVLAKNPWIQGVRVESAGLFQHAVVATDHKGH